jgi:TatD DNase family protein
MLDLAAKHRLPVIVHSREADDDTVELLREHVRRWRGDPARIGVLHCFTGTSEFARSVLDLGLMVSFSGIVTFRNADSLRAVAREVPEDRLLIETDTPYLAPVPQRGRPNEPAYVVHVAESLAKIRNDTVEHIAHSTARNALRLFGLTQEKEL